MVTNVIFASFTFIFFALEGAIMAQGLKLGLHIPLWLGYATSTIISVTLVIYGMKVLTKLPVHQFLEIYRDLMPSWAAMTLAVALVVISQVKINFTNAYSGSLAWTNSFTRVTRHYPGRLVFLGFNLVIALILMEADMFSFLNTLLGSYANCGMAWVVTVASDIVFNKYLLKLSPKKPEFRRGMLYAANPVGFGSALKPYSPLVAIGLALVLPPVIAIATKGRYYLRRTDDGIDLPMYDELGNPSGVELPCHVCRQDYERPDMAACHTCDAYVCSVCLGTDKVGDHVLPASPAPA